MIKFKSFIASINQAISSANDQLIEKNSNLLKEYFEEQSFDSESTLSFDAKGLKPKTITVQYPHEDQYGTVKMIDVDVPLITLAPITQTKIDKVLLKADFEMQIEDDELTLNFINSKRSRRESRKQTKGTLEIEIKPSEISDGFNHLIAGYEKVLKAQIPH